MKSNFKVILSCKINTRVRQVKPKLDFLDFIKLLVHLNYFCVFHSYLHHHWGSLVQYVMWILFFLHSVPFLWRKKALTPCRKSVFPCEMWIWRAVIIPAGRMTCHSLFHFISGQWDITDRRKKTKQSIKRPPHLPQSHVQGRNKRLTLLTWHGNLCCYGNQCPSPKNYLVLLCWAQQGFIGILLHPAFVTVPLKETWHRERMNSPLLSFCSTAAKSENSLLTVAWRVVLTWDWEVTAYWSYCFFMKWL